MKCSCKVLELFIIIYIARLLAACTSIFCRIEYMKAIVKVDIVLDFVLVLLICHTGLIKRSSSLNYR
jgi:amino acid permease